MEYQEDNNSVTIRGVIFATIIILPHYIFLLILGLYQFLKKTYRFFDENKWVVILLIIVFPLGIISLLTYVALIITALPIYALLDYYLLNLLYSKYSFYEGTKLIFVDIFFIEDSNILKLEPVSSVMD